MLGGAARARGLVQDYAFFFIAIDPAILLDDGEFEIQMADLIKSIKATPRGEATLARASRTCCCVTLKSASPHDFRMRPIKRSSPKGYLAPTSSARSSGAGAPSSLAAS